MIYGPYRIMIFCETSKPINLKKNKPLKSPKSQNLKTSLTNAFLSIYKSVDNYLALVDVFSGTG